MSLFVASDAGLYVGQSRNVVVRNNRVEIFDNDISDNDTANIIVSSYYATGYQGTREMAKDYDPYPDGLDLKALKVAMFGLNGSDNIVVGEVQHVPCKAAQLSSHPHCSANGASSSTQDPNSISTPVLFRMS